MLKIHDQSVSAESENKPTIHVDTGQFRHLNPVQEHSAEVNQWVGSISGGHGSVILGVRTLLQIDCSKLEKGWG